MPPNQPHPLLVLPFFIAFWLLLGALMAHASGWRSLAKRFRAIESIDGTRFRFASACMREWDTMPVSYGCCLKLIVGRAGFRLALPFAFRFLSPPLFIPWTEVESVVEKREWFRRMSQIRIRDSDIYVAIYGHAGECVAAMYEEGRLSNPSYASKEHSDRM